ncbi:MAG: hypothetical protein JXN65_00630 [Clostridia bacterium]|nr:hypothetical protein [Clostridia bacterium]
MEVIAARELNYLNIYLDIIFLIFLGLIFIFTKRYQALIFGLIGGALYFIVDYGIFYLALGTRAVTGANIFWFLLWLSMSYGFTNFSWIWLWLDRDKHSLEWSLLIITGWMATAFLGQNFGSNFSAISISRGTSTYHGVMAAILFIGYAILAVQNIKAGKKIHNIPWILGIGLLVQFAWEFVLLISGIRHAGFAPILINSLIETNLGLPFIYLIHRSVTNKYNEDLTAKV